MTAGASVSDAAAARPADASLLRAGATDESPICARVAMARSFWGRFRGLMGRAALADDEGLYLATNSIHMLFMRFPIDALFVGAPDGGGVRPVVGVRPGLRPWSGLVLPVKGAAGVVELPAGTIARAGLSVGDGVRLVEHARS
jgi:uncharacterized membrane protein (UPF0127 family)